MKVFLLIESNEDEVNVSAYSNADKLVRAVKDEFGDSFDYMMLENSAGGKAITEALGAWDGESTLSIEGDGVFVALEGIEVL